MDFGLRDATPVEMWDRQHETTVSTARANLAPLKSVLESDPVGAKILSILIEDGGWVPTSDLLRAARKLRPVVGAVTVGTILSRINELVSATLILSRTSLASGLDWAEWRIDPDLLGPTRKLLRMLRVPRVVRGTEVAPQEVLLRPE